jgi:hypothetical protein
MSNTHEDFSREIHGKGPSDRNFGLVFTVAFLFFGLWPLRHGNPVRPWLLALSGAVLLITLIRPSLLHGPNRVWTKLGILIGKVVNPIVTALLFYLVFTPGAFILRLMGRDLLGLSLNPDAKTYWIQRSVSTTDASTMKNQF